MTKVKEIIVLSPPRMSMGSAEEYFESAGYCCPECHGNRYYWGQDTDSLEPCKQICAVCGGSGEVTATVTVVWKGGAAPEARPAEKGAVRKEVCDE